MTNIQIVGVITEEIEQLLGITITGDRTIYFGESNLTHMKASHPKDFEKYGADLQSILAAPDYVGQNPGDGSIEYVKEYVINDDFVKVAVRIAGSGRYYARSLYILNNNRVRNYIAKNTLRKT